MVCDIYVETPFFSVYRRSRKDDVYYVFIGTVSKEIQAILRRLEKRESLSKEMVRQLRELYPNDYLSWIDVVKRKIKIQFIYGRICIDDTVYELRKKLFYYLSSPSQNTFLLPENQELWMKSKDKTYILGYTYENAQTNAVLSVASHLDEKYRLRDLEIDTRLNTSMNYYLLKDILDYYNIDNYTIYVSDAMDEMAYLKSRDVPIDIERYFKRYWPFVQLNVPALETRKKYSFIEKIYENQKKMEELVLNENLYLESCNIITIQMNINYDKKKESDIYNKEDMLDLYSIFETIKDKVDLSMPFLRYTENIFEDSFSIISTKAVEENRIDYETLKIWLKLNKEEEKRTNGIVVKRYLKDYDGEPRYISIQLNKNKTVQLSLSFYNKNQAGFQDVDEAVRECSSFIQNVNQIQSHKIRLPKMSYQNHEIRFSSNCKISYIRIMIPYQIPFPFEVSEWMEFARYFPNYLQEIPNSKSNNSDKSFRVKYIRISGYANMIDIIEFIDILKQNEHDDLYILKAIEKRFNKSLEEAKSYLLEWKRKYALQKSSWMEKNVNGILMVIKPESILVSGIKSVYHIPLLYNFMKKFVYLFVKSKENKSFLKWNKNIETKNQWMDYEYNSNAKIENIDLDMYNNEERYYEDKYYEDEELNVENHPNMNTENLKNENVSRTADVNAFMRRENIVGIAADDEITPEAQIHCKDPLPEKDTCQDFCNDPRYFLRRLQRFDNKLFRKSKNVKNDLDHYPRKCQRSFKQPVILPYNPEDNPRIKRDSYTYTMSYSSDPQLFQRWYICPKIWCPYCEIPIYEGDLDPATIRKKTTSGDRSVCKTAMCPYGDHQVFIKEESDGKVYMYPSFLNKTMHPNGFCLPCCALKSSNNPKAASYVKFKKCLGDEVEDKNIKNMQIYILGKEMPIEKDRYAKLSFDIAQILNTKIETGYLNHQKGFVRKGIKQEDKNNSFLSCICDLISCDKQNVFDVRKCKQILLEKCTDKLFRTLHNGNLQNIFNYPPLSPLENFKNYISSPTVMLDHTYLWDLLQRENILFENGMNIFIFEKNQLLCPFGNDVRHFYNEKRKNILLIRDKMYYEPIYYVEGKDKTFIKNCVFPIHQKELSNLFRVALEGCQSKYELDWSLVLKDNIKKYNIPIDNFSLDLGEDIYTVVNELIQGIQSKRLSPEFIPSLQYVDAYNKVFGIKLRCGLYIPIEPSRMFEDLPYEVVHTFERVSKLSMKDTLRYMSKLCQETRLKLNITHKITGNKKGESIVALLTEKNRVLPIQETKNRDTKYPVSVMSYHPDVNEMLARHEIRADKRMYYIYRKRFEEETYTRMRFELSKILKMNAASSHKIQSYIHQYAEQRVLHHTAVQTMRSHIYQELDKIFKTILSIRDQPFDFKTYTVPNKRVPCWKHKDALGCASDPHCIMDKKTCKLFLNSSNAVDSHIQNYNYYLSMISDELLRFNLKRKEIMDDTIPAILNREKIEASSRYFVIHNQNARETLELLDTLYHKKTDFFLNTQTLIDETSTKEYEFRKEKYIKFDVQLLNELKLDHLSIFWENQLGNKFKYLVEKESVISMLKSLLKVDEERNIIENVTQHNICMRIHNYIVENLHAVPIHTMIEYFASLWHESWNSSNSESALLLLYKKCSGKRFQYTTSFSNVLSEYYRNEYEGSMIDIYLFSKIYGYNILILDKRQKKDEVGYVFFENTYSHKYILLYRTFILDEIQFYIIKWKTKTIFKLSDFPMKFVSKFIKKQHHHNPHMSLEKKRIKVVSSRSKK
jgi:hypothetical protein